MRTFKTFTAFFVGVTLVGATPSAALASRMASQTPSVAQAATTQVKSPLKGMIDRGRIGTFHLPSGDMNGTVQGVVANVTWAALQPIENGPIVRGAANQLDVAIQRVTAYNNDHPSTRLEIKLRIFAGVDAPNWVKKINGFDPVLVANTQSGDAPSRPIGPFWRADYQSAYDQFQTKLASIYDTNPLLHEVTASDCMTVYAEPFMRDDTNFTALFKEGYTVAQDEQCEMSQVDAAKVWTHTNTSIAFNPWIPWTDTDGTAIQGPTDLAFTEQVMTYCREVLGARCTLENNSLNGAPPAEYAAMYSAMKVAGGAITFQTQTLSRMNNINTVLQQAASLGATAVELPVGLANWHGGLGHQQ
jgi:hypothetical protein